MIWFRNVKAYASYNKFSVEFEGWTSTILYIVSCEEKKEEIWLRPMTKAPTPTEMSKGQSDNTNNATKKFDYTAVAETHMKCLCRAFSNILRYM